MLAPSFPPMADPANIPGPDALIEGWQRLLQTGAHLHLPQIAAHLGVPEAALIAARVGTGAVRLRPDLARVLTPVCDWHRVLFVASTGLGVLMPMDDVETLETGPDGLTLSGPALRVRVQPDLAHEIYLFEDHDPRHGTSKTIQIFDRGGAALLKLVLFHKPSFRAAKSWTEDLAHPDQSRDWRPEGAMTPSFAAQPATATDRVWKPFRAALTSKIGSGEQITLAACRPGLDLAWSGQLTGSKGEGSALHLHEATLRAHLTLARAERGSPGALYVAGQSQPALSFREGGFR